MRTSIIIDDELLAEAMGVTGATMKKEVVEQSLRLLVKTERPRRALDDLAGIGWDGDLDQMRAGRPL